jgi:hypothetical protein
MAQVLVAPRIPQAAMADTSALESLRIYERIVDADKFPDW